MGKTTTREMVAAALSAKYQVYKTPGNSNSQVGVPITLSEITSADEIGVLELGMSMPGELTVIAKDRAGGYGGNHQCGNYAH
ncbi:MAG: Mur ligase family protein [Clostridium sp.]